MFPSTLSLWSISLLVESWLCPPYDVGVKVLKQEISLQYHWASNGQGWESKPGFATPASVDPKFCSQALCPRAPDRGERPRNWWAPRRGAILQVWWDKSCQGWKPISPWNWKIISSWNCISYHLFQFKIQLPMVTLNLKEKNPTLLFNMQWVQVHAENGQLNQSAWKIKRESELLLTSKPISSFRMTG